MASVFPNNPLGALPPETVKVFRLLERLPGDDEAIVAPNLQHMPGGAPPHILTLDSEQDEIAPSGCRSGCAASSAPWRSLIRRQRLPASISASAR